jgi:hypothetical protein
MTVSRQSLLALSYCVVVVVVVVVVFCCRCACVNGESGT